MQKLYLISNALDMIKETKFSIKWWDRESENVQGMLFSLKVYVIIGDVWLFETPENW